MACHRLKKAARRRLFLFIFQYSTAAVEKFLFSILILSILPGVAERIKAVLTEDLVDADGD